MAEHHQRPRLLLRAPRGGGELGQQRVVDGVALARPVQADPGHAVAHLVGDGTLGVHAAPPPGGLARVC